MNDESERFWMETAWFNRDCYTRIYRNGVRKNNEEQIADILAKIRTKHLPNTSQNAQ
jgi:hypothetical protein